MNSERFYVSELLIDVAVNKEFIFTSQEAVKYILPKLSGTVKRRESVIKRAMDRGVEDDVFMKRGDSYHLALPQGNTLESLGSMLNEEWNISNISLKPIVDGQKHNRKQKQKETNFRTETIRTGRKKNKKNPKSKKAGKPKSKKTLKKTKTNERNNITETARRKVNKKGKNPTTPDTDFKLEQDSDFSQDILTQSLEGCQKNKGEVDTDFSLDNCQKNKGQVDNSDFSLDDCRKNKDEVDNTDFSLDDCRKNKDEVDNTDLSLDDCQKNKGEVDNTDLETSSADEKDVYTSQYDKALNNYLFMDIE